jgi:hypothetical protein
VTTGLGVLVASTRQAEARVSVIEDPNGFAGPGIITRSFPFLPEHDRVDDFFCQNNRDYKPLFGKSDPSMTRDAQLTTHRGTEGHKRLSQAW